MPEVGSRLKSASAVCQEFSADIIIDAERDSIVFNVQSEFFDEIFRFLSNLGFILILKMEFSETVTCCFKKM